MSTQRFAPPLPSTGAISQKVMNKGLGHPSCQCLCLGSGMNRRVTFQVWFWLHSRWWMLQSKWWTGWWYYPHTSEFRAVHTAEYHLKRAEGTMRRCISAVSNSTRSSKGTRENDWLSLSASIYNTSELISWLGGLARARYLLSGRAAAGRTCLRPSFSALSSTGLEGDSWRTAGAQS